ncbi:MAG: glycosyltransferase family 4 protein [Bacteroidota bacterium]
MKQTLNILLICKSLPGTFIGGIQSHVWDLSESLISRGHKVSILSAGSMTQPTRAEVIEGRNIIYLRYFRGKHSPIFKVLLEEAGFNFSVFFWLKRNGRKFDIIHGQGRSGAWIPRKVSNSISCLTTYHGLIGIENAREKRNVFQKLDGWLHKKFASALEKRPLSRAKGIIYVSEATKNVVHEIHGNTESPQQVIYNGFKGDFSTKTERPMSIYLVFVGRLHPIKGLDALIQAMPMVNKFIKLVLVGDGPMRPELERLIRKEKLKERVILTGALPKDKAMEWMEKGFALILPSYFETQGIVLLEANAKKVPVLASYAGGMKEVVIDNYNGLFFEPGNPQDIARKINQLYESTESQKRLGENGQKLVKERFHWDMIGEQTEEYYYKVLQS